MAAFTTENALLLIDFINEIVHPDGRLAGKGYADFDARHGALARAGRWSDAAAAFDPLGDDAAARTYAAKCRALAAAGPDAAWDGVWNLTEK